MSSKIEQDRARFEKWHNDFYGPQDKFNPIRSLELHDEETGLGYVDPTVQAQFCAFQGAAPVVERQPVACSHEWTDDGEFTLTCTKCGLEENHEPYGWVQTRGDAINHFTQEWDVVQDWEDKGFEYKPMFDHAAPPELAELQATIAQLRLDLSNQTELTKQADYHATQRGKDIAQYVDEIERLKGGQGEAVAYRVKFNDGERSGWFDGPPASIDTDDVRDGVIAGLQLAYTSQPAPVSVVLPKRKPRAAADWRDIERGELADDAQAAGYNKALDDVQACIDKVKELNQ